VTGFQRRCHLDDNGNYSAPQILPGAAIVNLTATSAADPSPQTFASITIIGNFTLQIAAPADLAPGVTGAIVATMTPVLGSPPNSNFSWALSGAGCSGCTCGTLTVTTTEVAGANAISGSANYIAPSSVPQPNTVVPDVRQPPNISGGSACPVRGLINSPVRAASPSAGARHWAATLSPS
jgi:hypothetical protein